MKETAPRPPPLDFKGLPSRKLSAYSTAVSEVSSLRTPSTRAQTDRSVAPSILTSRWNLATERAGAGDRHRLEWLPHSSPRFSPTSPSGLRIPTSEFISSQHLASPRAQNRARPTAEERGAEVPPHLLIPSRVAKPQQSPEEFLNSASNVEFPRVNAAWLNTVGESPGTGWRVASVRSSFLKAQVEDDDRQSRRVSGATAETFRPLQPKDAPLLQRHIQQGGQHVSYYLALTGKPSTQGSSAQVWDATWQNEQGCIMNKTAAAKVLTIDPLAANAGPSFNDQLLGSHIKLGEAKNPERIQGAMYETAAGLGRVQTVYCSNKDGVSYPLIILPKMTPYDILKWKAKQEEKASRSWWNFIRRFCCCFEGVDAGESSV